MTFLKSKIFSILSLPYILLSFKSFFELTLTYLSQPHETMMGFWLLGENLTQETQSPWPSSWMVYLHWAKVFHNLMLLSLDPLTIWRLSAENATLMTSLVWLSNRRVVFPVDRSHKRRVLSHEPDKAKCPSEDKTTSETKCPWPWRRFWGTP